MTFLDRVSRFVSAAPNKQQAIGVLAEAQAQCAERASLLGRHADDAPNEASAVALRQLMGAEEAQAKRFHEALVAVGGRAQTSPVLPTASAGDNHWARVVQDLELHRQSVRYLQDSSFQLDEDFPELARLLAELSEEEQRHCEHLRALIARADPQALD